MPPPPPTQTDTRIASSVLHWPYRNERRLKAQVLASSTVVTRGLGQEPHNASVNARIPLIPRRHDLEEGWRLKSRLGHVAVSLPGKPAGAVGHPSPARRRTNGSTKMSPHFTTPRITAKQARVSCPRGFFTSCLNPPARLGYLLGFLPGGLFFNTTKFERQPLHPAYLETVASEMFALVG